MGIPVEIAAVCGGDINTQLITEQSDRLVNRTASFRSGHASAVATLARFGSAATGDPLYDAGVQLGKLLRTARHLVEIINLIMSERAIHGGVWKEGSGKRQTRNARIQGGHAGQWIHQQKGYQLQPGDCYRSIRS